MFTGIIEATGILESATPDLDNRLMIISSPLSGELKEDQSLSHNGVCLTVTGIEGQTHRVTAVRETLEKTCLGLLTPGSMINLERAVRLGDRLDGHILQGHIDCQAKCIWAIEQNGSWEFRFRYPPEFSHLVIEKGSISIDGISLTCFDVTDNEFTVAVIPYTFTHTNFRGLREGGRVNIEFDLIGKYIQRLAKKSFVHPENRPGHEL